MTESNKDQNLDRWKRFNSLKDTKKSINNLPVKAAAIAGHVLPSRPLRDDTIRFYKRSARKKICLYKRQTLNGQFLKKQISKLETKGKSSLYCPAVSHLIGQSLVVVKECLVRLPTTALLLWGNLSRDRLLQKAYSLKLLILRRRQEP